MDSFALQKLINLIRSRLYIFAFIPFVLEDWLKKTLVQFMSENVLPMFSSRNFMVSCIIFKSLTILSLFLWMVWESVLMSLIYRQLSSFPNTTYWSNCLFSIVYSCFLCHRLIDSKCVGLFLGSLFCSIDPCVYFCANTMLFWLL